MRPIDIQINNARIIGYQVELEGDVPEITASIELRSGAKKIATFTITTHSWSSGVKFQLPTGMIPPIVDIAKQLEVILVRECNKQLKQLPPVDAEVLNNEE